MKFSIIILTFILLPHLINSQTIQNEALGNATYSLDIGFASVPYTIQKNNSASIIHFHNWMDEEKPATPILPSRDIFIAIPANSIPKVEVQLLSKTQINAEPELNPKTLRENDSTLKYEKVTTPILLHQDKFYRINGYLWIGYNYCLHLTLFQYQYDFNKRIINENNKFRLILVFNSAFQQTDQTFSPVSPLILNSKFASEHQSSPDYHVQNTDDWIDYSKTYVKIGVAKDAVYRFDYNDLNSLGVSVVNIDPHTFQLINKGQAVPIYVWGENDGSFDPGDFIEFAGVRNMGVDYREVSSGEEPYHEYLGRYTDTTIYWLTWGGDQGLRVMLSDGNPSVQASDTLKYYSELIHKEINNWFDFSMADLVQREMPFWAPNKTWNEGNLGVGTYNANFSISDVYPDATAKMFVKLQDYASNISTNAHLLGLSLNNYPTVYDSGYIDKYQQKVLQGQFNSSLLTSGTNTVKVHSYPTIASLNICIKDWYELEYPRYIYPFNDSLNFSFNYLSNQGIYCFNINQVQGSSLTAWKFGDSYTKYYLDNSNGTAFIKDTINAENKFFISDSIKIQKPKLYYQKQFVNLRDNQNKADYLSITNKSLLNETSTYNNFIASAYNVETKAINVDDIYDEFAYGYFNPESIRDFLKVTHSYWQVPYPKYIFLIGDANYDYHLNKFIYQNTPPVLNIVPSFGSPVSDNWFVIWDTTGAYIPQMDIGRLPAHSPGELAAYLQKHQSYVNQPFDDWNKSYLFFSGGSENQNELDILRETNQHIIDNYIIPPPIGGNWYHFYKTLNPITNFGPFSQAFVQNAVDQGGIFISYLGHSGTQTWDNSIADPSQLHNEKNRYPMITDFGCSTAKFAEPDIVSFSELFVNSSKGQAISYLGNSSLGFTSTSITFPSIFYKKILQDSVLTISEAHKLAKLELLQDFGSSGTYKLFALTNELIGDPIVKLPIPQKPNLEIDGSGAEILTKNLSDLNDSVKISFKYFNWGSVTSDSFLIVLKDTYQQNIITVDSLFRRLPEYKDSLIANFPVLNRPGEHSITINLDAANTLDELNENDNGYTLEFYVASSRIRTLLGYESENGLANFLRIINPSLNSLSDSVEIEVAGNKDFINPSIYYMQMDSFSTRFTLPEQFANQRIWFRGKIYADNFFGFNLSAFNGTLNEFLLNDAESFNNSSFYGIKLNNGYLSLDTNKTEFKVISAGFNDGNTAVITRNGENFVLENTLRGHHVCVFEDSSYNFVEYRHFDLLGGDTSTVRAYINFWIAFQVMRLLRLLFPMRVIAD